MDSSSSTGGKRLVRKVELLEQLQEARLNLALKEKDMRIRELEIKLRDLRANSSRRVYYSEEQQYLDLIDRAIKDGDSQIVDRTRIGTYSIFGTTMRFNLRDGTIPLLTTKKMNFKAIVEELLWIISGSTNAKTLSDRGIKIWEANGSRQFLDACGFADREEGDLGPIYGFQLRHWGARYEDATTDYTGKG